MLTMLDVHLQDQYTDNGSAGSGVLSCIPSTLNRWTEEARVLDGDSVHDCVTGETSMYSARFFFGTLLSTNYVEIYTYLSKAELYVTHVENVIMLRLVCLFCVALCVLSAHLPSHPNFCC